MRKRVKQKARKKLRKQARKNESLGIHSDYLNKLTFDDNFISQRPNYFWYACPEGLIDIKDIPDYAGLVYISKSGMVNENIKKAPKLHKDIINDKKLDRVKMNFYYKYWNLRSELEEVINGRN